MKFVLLSHPENFSQLRMEWPFLKIVPDLALPGMVRFLKPRLRSEITIASRQGYLAGLPLLPHQVAENTRLCASKIAVLAKMLNGAGNNIVGLGRGLVPVREIFKHFDLRVASGYSVRLAGAMVAVQTLCQVQPAWARVVLLNPATAAGVAWAKWLALCYRHITLMGSFLPPIKRLAKRLLMQTGTAAVVSRINYNAVVRADLVVDLLGLDWEGVAVNNNSVIWAPLSPPAANTINDVVLNLPGQFPYDFSLLPGMAMPEMAEAVVQSAAGGKWPRAASEISLEMALAAMAICHELGIRVAGYVATGKVYLFEQPERFDKVPVPGL